MDNLSFNNIDSLISRLGGEYNVNKFKSVEDTLARLKSTYSNYTQTSQRPIAKEQTPQVPVKPPVKKQNADYQPSQIESLFITKLRDVKNAKVLFPEKFSRGGYAKIVESIANNRHLMDALSIVNQLGIKIDLARKVTLFRDNYLKLANTMSPSNAEIASEKFTKGFIKSVGSSIENLLTSSMRKLGANPNDRNYHKLVESIVNFLTDLGFVVPTFSRRFDDENNKSIWDVNRLVPEYNPDANQHGIIYKVELFPYIVQYYDEDDEDFDQMGILGRCNFYSMNVNK